MRGYEQTASNGAILSRGVGDAAKEKSCYPAFFLALDFAGCSAASLAGPVPAIGNNISRWSGFRFTCFLPLGGGAVLVAGVSFWIAFTFGASASMLWRSAAMT